MNYKVKGTEGLRNFLLNHSTENMDPTGMGRLSDETHFLRREGSINLKKDSGLFEGDTVIVLLEEYTDKTSLKVDTETVLYVVKHDDFLLKLVKS